MFVVEIRPTKHPVELQLQHFKSWKNSVTLQLATENTRLHKNRTQEQEQEQEAQW